MDQRKSHSTNGAAAGVFNDILTVVNGSSFATPAAFPSDRGFFIWGHDNDPIINTGVVINYPTDNGEVIETIFQREWKSQENGVVNGVTLEFDLSAVAGPGGVTGNNDLANLRLLVDEDGDYTAGATSIAPSSFNNITGIAYFQHDFIVASGNPLDQNRGFFFTLGSTDALSTPLPVELVHFEVTNEECSNLIEWSTASESNSDYYVIERSYDLAQWEQVGTVSGAGNSTQTLDYIYRDKGYEMNGMIYYRIVQFDVDGSNTEIGLQVVNSFCEDNYEPIAYPNPVTNELSIKSMLAGRVTVMDLNGRIVSQSEVAEGTTVVGMSHLTQGTYMMTIELSNGQSFMSQLVKM